MTLSRRDLEEGRMREVYIEALAEGHALTDEQLSESLTKTLNAKPKGAGWWVFAYGSLLWNPLFPFAESRRASVHGLHRRFCLLSLASRGTPRAPGLVLGLDRGGSCRGVAYRVPAPLTIDEQAEVIARASGAFGSSADYLERTRVSLATHGIVDLYLERLAARVAARGLVADTPIEVHVAASISAANESGD